MQRITIYCCHGGRNQSRDSSVGIGTRLTGWTIGVLRFDSRRELGIFLFTTASIPALGPTQPPIQWVSRALYLGVKRPVGEADHSPPSSAEVKEWLELYLHSPDTPSWRGAQLNHRDFTFYLNIHHDHLIFSAHVHDNLISTDDAM
jgi:hypothetical protein